MGGASAIARAFNSILVEHEGGGCSPFMRNLTYFNPFVHDCELIAGFEEYLFTWQMRNLQERLDHMLVNLTWRLCIQKATIQRLAPQKLDHTLI